MTTDVREAARAARSNPVLHALARGGYAADGVVHALIGVFVLRLAAGVSGGEADQAGALETIAGAPFGTVVLWALAIALVALAVYHAVAAVVAVGQDRLRTWGRRISEAGQALVFAVLGVLAASVALGARPRTDEGAEDASAGVLSIPGGALLIVAVGAGIAIGGIVFAVFGLLRSFRTRVEIPSGAWGRVVEVLGVVGYVAKGVALTTVGVLAVIAGLSGDAAQAGGLDDAADALLALPYGPIVVGAIGVGFLAYAAFLLLRARYARL